MTPWLKGIVGERGTLVLRDVYIFRLPMQDLLLKHDITEREVKLYVTRLARHLMYEERLIQFWLVRRRLKFNPDRLHRAVWKEYIADQIDDGRVTSEIAQELGQTLEYVNSFVG